MEWRGPDALRPLLVPLSSLTTDRENARRHPERNINAIRGSLREFGQRKPIVVRDEMVGTEANLIVVAGNGTVQAADLEGWTEIAVVRADDLTEAQARAYAIADNQTGDLAEWDPDALKASFALIPAELSAATGFTDEELKAISVGAYERKVEGEEEEFFTLKFTKGQGLVIEAAVEKMRKAQKDPGQELSVQRAIEFLCAEYVS